MPAPALIGAIVRGVAAAGSRVFASQAARGAATVAAKGAGQVATTGAAEAVGGAASKAPGFVIQHAPDNAKAITAALRGVNTSAANTAAQASQAQAAAPAMEQQAGKAAGKAAEAAGAPQPAKPSRWKGGPDPTPASPTAAETAAAGSKPPPGPPKPPGTPPSPQPSPQPPNGPGKSGPAKSPTAAQQAAAPQKESFLERAGKLAEKARDVYNSAKERANSIRNLDFMRSQKSKSVGEETQGMSLEERYKRLEQNGTLLSPQSVAKASGVAFPSQQDVVGASEKAEQQERERHDAERARSETAGKSAMQAVGTAAMSVAAIQVTWPLIFMKAGEAVEKFATGTLENSRNLQRYDAAIARTFAKLDHQNLVLQMRTAQATGGSTASLGRSLGELRKELQPFRENMMIAVNLGVTCLVQIAWVAVKVAEWSPIINAAGAFLQWYEGEQRKKNPAGQDAFDVHFGAMLRGDFSRPKNSRPSEDGK